MPQIRGTHRQMVMTAQGRRQPPTEVRFPHLILQSGNGLRPRPASPIAATAPSDAGEASGSPALLLIAGWQPPSAYQWAIGCRTMPPAPLVRHVGFLEETVDLLVAEALCLAQAVMHEGLVGAVLSALRRSSPNLCVLKSVGLNSPSRVRGTSSVNVPTRVVSSRLREPLRIPVGLEVFRHFSRKHLV